jgi:RNA polymerase sigma-70 factor (ECF subfamily)
VRLVPLSELSSSRRATWAAAEEHSASGEHRIESGTRERTDSNRAILAAVSDGADLVARCRAGEPAAFRQLFREHRAQVTRLVHRMTGGSAELEDLVQDVFVQVHKSLGSFRREARLSTWIYRIAINVVLMHRRALRSRPPTIPAPADAPRGDEEQPDEQLARGRRVAALYRLLDRMSEKKRTVYVLHEIEGLSPAEISKIVGAPVLTVRTRLFYARRSLLAELASEPSLAALAEALPPLSDPAPAGAEPHKEPA